MPFEFVESGKPREMKLKSRVTVNNPDTAAKLAFVDWVAQIFATAKLYRLVVESGQGRRHCTWHANCSGDGMNIAKLSQRVLGGMLVFAGVSHLTFARRAFRAQVPEWVPLSKDQTVLASGVAEIALGASLALARGALRPTVGKIAAAFFVAVFPGNVSQYMHRRSAFGLDTDAKRFGRLFFQPALVYWALKSAKSEPSPG